jgi:hypothetical protein
MALDDKILSIDSDDDNNDYELFNSYLEEDTNRKKSRTAIDFEQMGNQFLKEIEIKNKRKEFKKKNILIPYIVKNSTYGVDELISYSFEDVQNIFNEIKKEKRPTIIKFFHFIFNIE